MNTLLNISPVDKMCAYLHSEFSDYELEVHVLSDGRWTIWLNKQKCHGFRGETTIEKEITITPSGNVVVEDFK